MSAVPSGQPGSRSVPAGRTGATAAAADSCGEAAADVVGGDSDGGGELAAWPGGGAGMGLSSGDEVSEAERRAEEQFK